MSKMPKSKFPEPEKVADELRTLLHSTLSDELQDAVSKNISQSHVTAKIIFTNMVEKTCDANFGNMSKQELTEMVNRLKNSHLNAEYEEMCVKLKRDK